MTETRWTVAVKPRPTAGASSQVSTARHRHVDRAQACQPVAGSVDSTKDGAAGVEPGCLVVDALAAPSHPRLRVQARRHLLHLATAVLGCPGTLGRPVVPNT